ncbi:MAG: polymer-forming cytoskeletal protein [Spirochaetia bacterium]
MADLINNEDPFVNSIVGVGTRFRGDLQLNGLLRIDGDFAGTVQSTSRVLVSENGRAESSIQASEVVVGGIVKGNILASVSVKVLSTGMVIGNITAPKLEIEEKVILHGTCRVVSREQVEKLIAEKQAAQRAENVQDISQYDPRKKEKEKLKQSGEFSASASGFPLRQAAGGEKDPDFFLHRE